jgi:peroxiredoxin Q/BCP
MTLTVGQPAPNFTLPSSDGGTFALDDLRGTHVVVYFYPRDNTPGCTIEAQEFRDAVPALAKLGARVVGISKDSVASHCKFRDKFKLSFPLLSDPDGKVLEQYGAWGKKMMYGKPMTGIIRSTVLVDADGKVAKVWPKVSVKGHAQEVVAAVAELSGKKAPAAAKAKPAGGAKKKSR